MTKEYIEQIKRINLAEFVQCFSFEINKAKSSRKQPVLQHKQSGHTIIIKQHPNGHHTFFESEKAAKGTIIDFLKWQGVGYYKIPATIEGYEQGKLKPINSVKISASDNNARKAFSMQPYSEAKKGLLDVRGISASTLLHPLFHNRIGSYKGNACFPLYDKDGMCGLRRTNKMIVSGSKRGLWVANRPDLCGYDQNYETLITESPIDNLSFEQMKRFNSYHIATCGTPTAEQLKTIKYIAEKTGQPVILGFDNDEKGNMFADQIGELIKDIVPTLRVWPTLNDWNDDLIAMLQEHPETNELF